MDSKDGTCRPLLRYYLMGNYLKIIFVCFPVETKEVSRKNLDTVRDTHRCFVIK